MGSAEKFCLRWNDFETNVSTAFRELRDDKDFFDVTLACDDDQVPAHKVILAACSPFFRTILRRNRHEHPLLYLKGVKYVDLLAVLNFMYHGEVNVAQEELNSFLAVAEDLKVKGLTQGSDKAPPGGGGGGGVGSSSLSGHQAKSRHLHHRDSPSDSPSQPPAKRARPSATANSNSVVAGGSSSSGTSSGGGGGGGASINSKSLMVDNVHYDDDDIQEVVPVKTEPVTAPSDSSGPGGDDGGGGGDGGGAMVVDQYGHEVADQEIEFGGDGDYGDYEGGYEGDGSFETGMMDPNLSGADGNKVRSVLEKASPVIANPSSYMVKGTSDRGMAVWQCLACPKETKNKSHMEEHIETWHVENFRIECDMCGGEYGSRRGMREHYKKEHGIGVKPKHIFIT